jgi:hypothetical protein
VWATPESSESLSSELHPNSAVPAQSDFGTSLRVAPLTIEADAGAGPMVEAPCRPWCGRAYQWYCPRANPSSPEDRSSDLPLVAPVGTVDDPELNPEDKNKKVRDHPADGKIVMRWPPSSAKLRRQRAINLWLRRYSRFGPLVRPPSLVALNDA